MTVDQFKQLIELNRENMALMKELMTKKKMKRADRILKSEILKFNIELMEDLLKL